MTIYHCKYSANIWKLKAIRMFFWMHFFAAVLIPFYSEWGGLRLSEVMVLNSWFMFWNFVLEVPTGTIADFLGRKTSLVLGSVLAAGAALLYVSKPGLYVFLMAEFIFAIAYTLHSGADEALAYDSLIAIDREKDSRSLLANMESFKLVGIIVATVIGGFIAGSFGYDAPMRFYAIPALFAFVLSLSLNEPPVQEIGALKKSYIVILKEGGRFFLNNKVLMLLTAELTLTNALAWGLIWLFQPLLASAGLAVAYFGLVHAASCLGQILFLSSLDRIEQAVGAKRRVLLLATFLTGAAFILLGLTSYLPIVAIGIVLAFSFSLPRIPIFSSYMNKYIPSDKRATVLSFISMCRTFAIVIINPIIGWLADWSVSHTMLILGVSLIVVTVFSRIEEKHLVD